MNESSETLVLTKADAEMQIRALLQEAHTMGNNDHELGDFATILDGLASDELTPEAALEKATALRYSKLETSSM